PRARLRQRLPRLRPVPRGVRQKRTPPFVERIRLCDERRGERLRDRRDPEGRVDLDRLPPPELEHPARGKARRTARMQGRCRARDAGRLERRRELVRERKPRIHAGFATLPPTQPRLARAPSLARRAEARETTTREDGSWPSPRKRSRT